MAQASKAYTIPDPVQDGDRDLLHALLLGDQTGQGDYHSLSGTVDVEDDLDSLFNEPLDCQTTTDLMIPDDAEFLLPDFGLLLDAPVDNELDALFSASELYHSPIVPEIRHDLQTSRVQHSPQANNALTLPVPSSQSDHILTLVQPLPVATSGLTTINQPSKNGSIDLTEAILTRLPDRTPPRKSIDPISLITAIGSESQSDSAAARCPSTTPVSRVQEVLSDPACTHSLMEQELPLIISSVSDHIKLLDTKPDARSTNVESFRGRTRDPYTPPSSTSPEESTNAAPSVDGHSKTALPETALIRRGNCSPIRSLFTREPVEEPSKKKRKTSKTQSINAQPSKENLRLSLMLDIRAYHYLVEKVKLFMLDRKHPQRYQHAVTEIIRLEPDELITHERRLQDLATALLREEDLAETWWGVNSFGYEKRDLKWPRDKSAIITSVVKLLIRVCRDHQDKQQIKPFTVSSEDAEKMAEVASRKALQDRINLARNNIECHISFVLADNLRFAIREKVIASTTTYPRYMDLVNFLVKLITDRYTMTGLGVMGPLGYAKVNNQWEWEAMVEVIRTTPTMSSIALCTVEAQPHAPTDQIGGTHKVSKKAVQVAAEVIEID